MRLGKLEKEILVWLDEQKEYPSPAEIEHTFARFTRGAGDRSGHSNYSQIWNILKRLEKKGFLVIMNPNRTNSQVIRVGKSILGD